MGPARTIYRGWLGYFTWRKRVFLPTEGFSPWCRLPELSSWTETPRRHCVKRKRWRAIRSETMKCASAPGPGADSFELAKPAAPLASRCPKASKRLTTCFRSGKRSRQSKMGASPGTGKPRRREDERPKPITETLSHRDTEKKLISKGFSVALWLCDKFLILSLSERGLPRSGVAPEQNSVGYISSNGCILLRTDRRTP